MGFALKIFEALKGKIIRRRRFADWDSIYLSGKAPWDTGTYCPELEKALDELNLSGPVKALELGCGSGTNCIYMAEKGFEVTGVDYSGAAIEMAEEKAVKKNVNIKFLQTKLPELPLEIEEYDFIFDRGCFHSIPLITREDYSAMVYNLLKKNGKFLLLTGNARKPQNPGPPVLTEDEIDEVFSGKLKKLWIRDGRFTLSTKPESGALAHCCLFERTD